MTREQFGYLLAQSVINEIQPVRGSDVAAIERLNDLTDYKIGCIRRMTIDEYAFVQRMDALFSSINIMSTLLTI